MSETPCSGEVIKSPTRREKLASINGVGTNRSATNPFIAEVKDFDITAQTRQRSMSNREVSLGVFVDHEHNDLVVGARKETLHLLKKNLTHYLRTTTNLRY